MSREAFEAWALRNTSLSSAHEMAWAAWQAALAQPQVEPVAYIAHTGDSRNLCWHNPGGEKTPLYAAPPVPAVPGDMVMVPREPTPEMNACGSVALYRVSGKDIDATGREIAAAYRAMIAAAPAQPADLIPPDALFVCGQMGAHVTRVRAEAAQPAAREPLTDERIVELWAEACKKQTLTRDLVRDFARSVLSAAHGITGESK